MCVNRTTTVHEHAVPDMADSERRKEFQVAGFEALVEMKLNSCREKDKTDLREMVDVGGFDFDWPRQLPRKTFARLSCDALPIHADVRLV